MPDLVPYLPYIIPLLIIQLTLMLVALFHILSHEHFKRGTKVMWIIIVIFVNIFGPILYFVLGKADEA